MIASEEGWDFQAPIAIKEREDLATTGISESDDLTALVMSPKKSKLRENSKKQAATLTSNCEKELQEMQEMMKKLRIKNVKMAKMLKKRDEMLKQKDKEL